MLSSFARGPRLLLGNAVARRHLNVPPHLRIHRPPHPRRSDLPSDDAIANLGVSQSHLDAVEAVADPTGDGSGRDVIFPGSINFGPAVFKPQCPGGPTTVRFLRVFRVASGAGQRGTL